MKLGSSRHSRTSLSDGGLLALDRALRGLDGRFDLADGSPGFAGPAARVDDHDGGARGGHAAAQFGMNVTWSRSVTRSLLARECATIDFLSNGRLLPAFGVGPTSHRMARRRAARRQARPDLRGARDHGAPLTVNGSRSRAPHYATATSRSRHCRYSDHCRSGSAAQRGRDPAGAPRTAAGWRRSPEQVGR